MIGEGVTSCDPCVKSARLRDDGRRIEDFIGLVIVVCPRCGERADVRPFDRPFAAWEPGDVATRASTETVNWGRFRYTIQRNCPQ